MKQLIILFCILALGNCRITKTIGQWVCYYCSMGKTSSLSNSKVNPKKGECSESPVFKHILAIFSHTTLEIYINLESMQEGTNLTSKV